MPNVLLEITSEGDWQISVDNSYIAETEGKVYVFVILNKVLDGKE